MRKLIVHRSSTSTTIAPNAHNGIETKSGGQIVAAAVAATKRQSSFHFVESAGEGSNGVVVVGDVGTSSGEQHVTIRDGKKVGHITLLLAGKTAYFQGDALGLEGFTGLSATLSAQYARKWISVPSSNTSFSTIAGTLAGRHGGNPVREASRNPHPGPDLHPVRSGGGGGQGGGQDQLRQPRPDALRGDDG